jgi:hypothetical protein
MNQEGEHYPRDDTEAHRPNVGLGETTTFREQFDSNEEFLAACSKKHFVTLDHEYTTTMRGQKLLILAVFLSRPDEALTYNDFAVAGTRANHP